ncbi:MAG: hypothetical protein ACFBSE_27220 [Prochloraceae cyanobacterium]
MTYRDSQNVENAFSFCYNTFSIFSHGSFALGTTTPRAFIFAKNFTKKADIDRSALYNKIIIDC